MKKMTSNFLSCFPLVFTIRALSGVPSSRGRVQRIFWTSPYPRVSENRILLTQQKISLPDTFMYKIHNTHKVSWALSGKFMMWINILVYTCSLETVLLGKGPFTASYPWWNDKEDLHNIKDHEFFQLPSGNPGNLTKKDSSVGGTRQFCW